MINRWVIITKKNSAEFVEKWGGERGRPFLVIDEEGEKINSNTVGANDKFSVLIINGTLIDAFDKNAFAPSGDKIGFWIHTGSNKLIEKYLSDSPKLGPILNLKIEDCFCYGSQINLHIYNDAAEMVKVTSDHLELDKLLELLNRKCLYSEGKLAGILSTLLGLPGDK